MKLNLKKDDKVMVIAGRDKGKVGKVLKTIPEKNRALVEKVNMIKRHTKGGQGGQAGGGIIEKEASLHISNLALLCEKCSAPSRVGRKVLEDGRRVRYCKKCGEQVDK